jgi:single-strand DNA-binding protein
MEITNKGYINFNEKYNKKTDKFMSASMSFSNGKDEQGNWVNGYINVVAFGDNIEKLEASIGNLVEVKGRYSHKKADEKGVYPQIAITEFLTEVETKPFGNQSVDISAIDMPF